MDAGVDQKNIRQNILTTFGNTIIAQVATFDFLSRNKEYFSSHTSRE
jgi:hypothetical protein